MELVLLIVCVLFFFLVLSRIKANQDRNKLLLKLKELTEKSQLEQDIELATTEQLMIELAKRTPGFIFILPVATNKEEQGLGIHIKGMPPSVAIACLSAACEVISTYPPKEV